MKLKDILYLLDNKSSIRLSWYNPIACCRFVKDFSNFVDYKDLPGLCSDNDLLIRDVKRIVPIMRYNVIYLYIELI